MTTPPNITVSANIGPTGRVRVYYTPPTASDGGDPLTVRCSPAPGSEFPVGSTTVTCTATDLAGNVRTRTFTVTVVADAAATVPTAPAGTTVVVTASGFAANSWVYVSVNSDPTPIGVFQADAQGRLTLTLTVPEGLPPGEHTVVVEGFAPDGSVRQFVQPIVVPGAEPAASTTVTPRIGLPGTGSDSSGGLTVAALITLVGLAVLLATRRRAT
jgi:LPXTG-motif cell wall-anchored protein